MEFPVANTTLLMRRSLEFLWDKQACITDNLANVETPGYQAKYVTFEEALRDALLAEADGSTPVRDMRETIQNAVIQHHEAEESTRMDENGVNVLDQSVELARNAYQLQYAMSAISSDLTTLRTAITG